jgi:hypothetical protein
MILPVHTGRIAFVVFRSTTPWREQQRGFGGGAGRGKQRDAATKFAAVWAPAKGNAKRKSNDPGILAESNSITRST